MLTFYHIASLKEEKYFVSLLGRANSQTLSQSVAKKIKLKNTNKVSGRLTTSNVTEPAKTGHICT